MLSPDVPEFIPRSHQTSSLPRREENSSGTGGWRHQQEQPHTAWDASHTHSAPAQYASNNQTTIKENPSKYSPGKTKTEERDRSKFTQYRPAPPKRDVSASNNRNSDASNWRVKMGVHDTSRDLSSHDHLPSQKSNVNRTAHSSETEKYQQDKDNPTKGKAKKYNYATSETYLMRNTSIKQRSNHEDGVSYQKVLQRNQDDGITWEPQPSSSPATSLPLNEQWPTLGDSRTQTTVGGTKKNTEVKKQQGAWLGSNIDTPPVRENLDNNRNNMRVPTSTWIAQSSSYARDVRHSYKDKGGVGNEAKSLSYNERPKVESCENIAGTKFKVGKTGFDQITVSTHKPRQITSKYESNKEYNDHSNQLAKSGRSSGEDCVTSLQKNIDNSMGKSFPALGKSDAIEWQVRREKKKQTKTKELHKTGQSPLCKMDILVGDSGRREPALASGGDKVVRGVIVLGNNKDTKNKSWSRGTKYNRRQENGEHRNYSGEFREDLQGSLVSDNKQASASVGLYAEKCYTHEKMTKNTDKDQSGEGKTQKPVNPVIAQRNLELTKLGESDPFDWQVKGFKKKQAKAKEVYSEKNWSPQLERKMPDKESGGRARVPASARKITTPGVVILKNKQDTAKASRPRNDRFSEKHEKDMTDCAGVFQEKRNKASWGSDKNQTRLTPSSQLEKRFDGESMAENRKQLEESPTDAKPQQPLDPKAARKKLEAKQKKKEEKIRNREEKIKHAQQNLNKDSKVTVVTREFLEKSYKTSVNKSAFISKHQLMSIEEYPTLLTARTHVTGAAPMKNLHSSTLAHRTDTASWSTRDNDDINKDSEIPYKSEQSSVSDEESPNEINTSTPASTISYSGALQAAKMAHKTSRQSRRIANPPPVPEASYVTPQKKKVKTKDLIEFDLMAFALQSKRNKMKAVEDPKEKAPRTLKGRKIGLATTAAAAARLSKVKGVTVVKRGKQREKKKGVTNLKKALLKMKQNKAEALILLLQVSKTAKERQEALKCEATSTPADPLLPTVIEKEGEENEEENSKITPDKTVIQGEENNEEIQEDTDDKGREAEENTQRLVHLMEQVVGDNQGNKAEECDDKQKLASMEKCSENEAIIKVLPQPDANNQDFAMDYEKARLLITEEIKVLQDPFQTSEFREYCDHVITYEVNQTVTQLVKSVVKFQQQHFARDPTKATIRRRYVCGLKQTTKLMGKMTCLIIAPNIQHCPLPGGLNEAVEKTLHQARHHSVPVVFALSIKKLGNLCYKRYTVSCLGIISYQGAQDTFHKLMNLVASARDQYRTMINSGGKSSSLTHGQQDKASEHENSPDLGLHLTEKEKSSKPAPDYHTLLLSALLSTPNLSTQADSLHQIPYLTTQEFSEE